MKDRSDDPSHHDQMPFPRSYISLPFLNVPFCDLYNLYVSVKNVLTTSISTLIIRNIKIDKYITYLFL